MKVLCEAVAASMCLPHHSARRERRLETRRCQFSRGRRYSDRCPALFGTALQLPPAMTLVIRSCARVAHHGAHECVGVGSMRLGLWARSAYRLKRCVLSRRTLHKAMVCAGVLRCALARRLLATRKAHGPLGPTDPTLDGFFVRHSWPQSSARQKTFRDVFARAMQQKCHRLIQR